MKKLFVIFTILTALLSACGGTIAPVSNTSSAPDFELPNALGGNVSLNDYQGKNVLLFFHMAVG